MGRFFSFAALVVGGLIVADVLLHPSGVSAAASGFNTATTPTIQGLVGQNVS
ncbi:MAG TPA: hypothetical protein VKU91_01400 [Acidimicrobiales bacterium]|nr:hypothetical protein [Acidimicrobiales bacterium]